MSLKVAVVKLKKVKKYSNIIKEVKIVPNGVFCLTSALALHNLTTYTPYE
ncbi:hypothetical protein [Clostridium gasigenes]|nr:hypothetical protein [Clostridium gasigenes]MBU3108072.1 hypothetical protein [Clostridium gasigenes]